MQQGFKVKYFHDQVEKSPGKYFFTLYKMTIGEIPNLFLIHFVHAQSFTSLLKKGKTI